jgi:hypothetical protein
LSFVLIGELIQQLVSSNEEEKQNPDLIVLKSKKIFFKFIFLKKMI